MAGLQEMPGIGSVLEQELLAIGIETPEQLRQEGSEKVFMRLRENDPEACLHKLYALESAVLGVKKPEIPTTRKAELKAFFQTLS